MKNTRFYLNINRQPLQCRSYFFWCIYVAVKRHNKSHYNYIPVVPQRTCSILRVLQSPCNIRHIKKILSYTIVWAGRFSVKKPSTIVSHSRKNIWVLLLAPLRDYNVIASIYLRSIAKFRCKLNTDTELNNQLWYNHNHTQRRNVERP
jgi:hypothetical protein